MPGIMEVDDIAGVRWFNQVFAERLDDTLMRRLLGRGKHTNIFRAESAPGNQHRANRRDVRHGVQYRPVLV